MKEGTVEFTQNAARAQRDQMDESLVKMADGLYEGLTNRQVGVSEEGEGDSGGLSFRSHPTSSPSAGSLDSTFTIHPESDRFHPPCSSHQDPSCRHLLLLK